MLIEKESPAAGVAWLSSATIGKDVGHLCLWKALCISILNHYATLLSF